ncbi:MAG: AAC(3) family N-acetyltransferase [Bacteroidetes bacterium]|nr:AAC(3) family N-acetyltransferase [Bacteroidota bacterium]
MGTEDYVPYLQIASKLALQPGDWIMVSADISRLAFMAKRREGDFQAQKFIKSLYEAVQPGGTIIIPAYNYLLQDGDTFDLKNTRPVTGTLAVEALKMNGFKRTKHPLHSFAVMGKGQDELCKLNNTGSFDEDSPFAIMYQRKAKALIIGLDLHSTFTFTHYVEEMANVAYRYKKKFTLNYIDGQGTAVKKQFSMFSKYPWIGLNFNPLEKMLVPADLQQSNINGCSFRIIDLAKAYHIIYKEIKENKAKNITYFDLKRGFKELSKNLLRKLGLYKTLTEKVHNATDL